jgi:hypothetical protein
MTAAFPYPAEIEKSMQVMYRSLRENDRRRYAAVEVAKLGHGGTDYIAGLLGCDPKTIRRGQADLDRLQAVPLEEIGPADRVRKRGGDRPLVEKVPELVPAFQAVLEDPTAGSPLRQDILWTDSTPREIQLNRMEHDLMSNDHPDR